MGSPPIDRGWAWVVLAGYFIKIVRFVQSSLIIVFVANKLSAVGV